MSNNNKQKWRVNFFRKPDKENFEIGDTVICSDCTYENVQNILGEIIDIQPARNEQWGFWFWQYVVLFDNKTLLMLKNYQISKI